MTILSVFLPFAFGYFVSYLFRVINNVIAPDLSTELSLDAGALGLMTSAYFLTFAAFQLPLGVLLDRFGPRRTEAGLLVIAACGAALFAVSESMTGLLVGRALIGLGVSACLMASFKAFVVWFPRERLPLVNGCQMAAGGLGALAGATPVELVLQVIDWRTLFGVLAVLTLATSAIIARVVPERAVPGRRETFHAQVAGIGTVFRSTLFWRVAPVTVFSQATFLALQSLWSGPWLRDVAGVGRDHVAMGLSLIATGMIAGFLFFGWSAARASRLGVPPLHVAIGGMSAFMVVQAVLIIFEPKQGALIAWAAFGFFGSAGIVPYAALSQRYPARLAGRLNTGLNLLAFAMAFVTQWAVGEVIAGLTADDLALPPGHYDPDSYGPAFAIMLALQLAALAWFWLFRRDGVPPA